MDFFEFRQQLDELSSDLLNRAQTKAAQRAHSQRHQSNKHKTYADRDKKMTQSKSTVGPAPKRDRGFRDAAASDYRKSRKFKQAAAKSDRQSDKFHDAAAQQKSKERKQKVGSAVNKVKGMFKKKD